MNLDKRLTEAAKKVVRLEAANERLSAALRAEEESFNHGGECDDCYKLRDESTDVHASSRCPESLRLAHRAYDLRRAALSDTGEGWLEQVARVKEAAQPLLSGGPVGCYHCTVEVGGDGQPRHGRGCPAQEFRAALDALGGK